MFDAIRNTFSIKGRAKRTEFNYFMFLLLVFAIIISSPLEQYSENLIIILLMISIYFYGISIMAEGPSVNLWDKSLIL